MKQTKKKINIKKSTKKIKFQSLLGGAKGKSKKGKGGTPRKVGGLELQGEKNIENGKISSKGPNAGFLIILFKDSNKKLWVLVQQRSLKKFMPGFWGVSGGEFDSKKDKIYKDTLETAIRETIEETDLFSLFMRKSKKRVKIKSLSYITKIIGPRKKIFKLLKKQSKI